MESREARPAQAFMNDRCLVLLFRSSLVGSMLGLAATFYFLAGLAGYVHSVLLNFLIAAALAGAAVFFLKEFIAITQTTHWLGRAIWSAILCVLAVQILLSLTPPIARDELTHHLAIPRIYAQQGRIVEIPFAPYAYFPMLLDMLYTPWVYWQLDFVPKLVHGLFGFLTGLLLYAYLARRMNAVYGLLGFFFFISVPVVLRLTHTAYVDLGVAFYSTASLLCLLHWREDRQATAWLSLSALSAGFAVAAKPNGLVALLLLSFLFVFTWAQAPNRGSGRMAAELALFGVLALAPFLPWLAKNLLQTGNPFYPLFGGWFGGSHGGAPGAAATFVELGIFNKRALLYGESWWEIAALPVRVFFSGVDDNPQYFDGALSPALVALLPWAFRGKWREEKKLCISFALLFLAYAMFLVDLRARYILAIVPPLVILLAYGTFNVYLRMAQPAYLFAGLLFFAGFHLTYLWDYLHSVAPVRYLIGAESRDAYLTAKLPEYPAFRYINEQTPEAAKIYLLFIGRRAYYSRRAYIHDPGELPALLVDAIRVSHQPSEIEQKLKRAGITHLLAREDLLKRFLSDNLEATERAVWNAFVTLRTEKRFEDRGYAVYQLNG